MEPRRTTATAADHGVKTFWPRHEHGETRLYTARPLTLPYGLTPSKKKEKGGDFTGD